jgi:hypothetical protein
MVSNSGANSARARFAGSRAEPVKRPFRSADSGFVMRDTSLLQLATDGHRKRYRVELLPDAQPCEQGIRFGGGVLGWEAIQSAVVAEVGEPEGVRAVIFDLVVARVASPGGVVFEVRRLDAEPGEDAMRVAQAIARGLVSEATSPSIKGLAAEGIASQRYHDLEEFEAAALESLGS